jgi:hypothetical protein
MIGGEPAGNGSGMGTEQRHESDQRPTASATTLTVNGECHA